MNYRNLTADEISRLEADGCRSLSWDRISVSADFKTGSVRNTEFSGDVRLGVFNKTLTGSAGQPEAAGIYGSRIHNCSIEDNCLVRNTGLLANYTLQSGALVDSVAVLAVRGESSFGNGTELSVLNEGGGRELLICDISSAQTAYMQVMYRHDPRAVSALQDLVKKYTSAVTADMGSISGSTSVRNSSELYELRTVGNVKISGARRLENGSIIGEPGAPTFVGAGVSARNFIIQSGSRIDDSVILDGCFIGQAVKMGKQFSAENCVFFCNSELFHGEGCSVFGGPYTVSHHKSSLLIAGAYSFFNAGSGTNQSNHLYKLGPLHQAVLQRGSKTGSFSYMLCPSRVGAFSAVIGKHYSNFDASDFPFSYISEEEGKSVLTPAMNLLTVGTRRDSDKWPKRDRRKGEKRLDLIHFDFLSPWLTNRILKGASVLKDLYEKTDRKRENVIYNGLTIRRLMLKSSGKYYDLALKIAKGRALAAMLQSTEAEVAALEVLNADMSVLDAQWVDMAGMILRKDRLLELLHKVKSASIETAEELDTELRKLYDRYSADSRDYFAALIRRDMSGSASVRELFQTILSEYAASAVKLNNMILADADKEFSPVMMYGYGTDGDDSEKQRDFEAVRGRRDDNAFILSLQDENAAVAVLANELSEKSAVLT